MRLLRGPRLGGTALVTGTPVTLRAVPGTRRLSHLPGFPEDGGRELAPPGPGMRCCLLCLLRPSGLWGAGSHRVPRGGGRGTLAGPGAISRGTASGEGGPGLRQLPVLSGSSTVTR